MVELEKLSQVIYDFNVIDYSVYDYKDEHIIKIIEGVIYQKLLKDNGYDIATSKLNNYITCLAFIENCVVGIKDVEYIVRRGDLLILVNIEDYHISSSNYKVYKVYYQKNIFNNDNKEYTVKASLIDEYEITVSAESEDEALSTAYNIPLEKWNHLPDKNPSNIRPIIRKATWGNLEIKK